MNTTTLPLLSLVLAGCVTPPTDALSATPQDRFWAALENHCGEAYAGSLVSDDAADADMRGAAMVMHVRECDAARIAVPFHIRNADGSWNRSRTWIFTRLGQGEDTRIRLKHDHRHEDGISDAVTLYGGDTADTGTQTRQSFPVDDDSIAMFRLHGLDASVTNIWHVTVDPARMPDARFTYALERNVARGAPQDRDFRVAFDLTRPISPPPPPWGF
ncbi:MAG: hypothetical protein WA948_03105 [Pontixanthobacter sp.]